MHGMNKTKSTQNVSLKTPKGSPLVRCTLNGNGGQNIECEVEWIQLAQNKVQRDILRIY